MNHERPIVDENIEDVPKLEWGPFQGRMSSNKLNRVLARLNDDLKKGEKKWRLPTKDELNDEIHKEGVGTRFPSGYFWTQTGSFGSCGVHSSYMCGEYEDGDTTQRVVVRYVYFVRDIV